MVCVMKYNLKSSGYILYPLYNLFIVSETLLILSQLWKKQKSDLYKIYVRILKNTLNSIMWLCMCIPVYKSLSMSMDLICVWMPPVCVLFAYMCEVVQYLIFPDLSCCLAALYSSCRGCANSPVCLCSWFSPCRCFWDPLFVFLFFFVFYASHRPPTQVS